MGPGGKLSTFPNSEVIETQSPPQARKQKLLAQTPHPTRLLRKSQPWDKVRHPS